MSPGTAAARLRFREVQRRPLWSYLILVAVAVAAGLCVARLLGPEPLARKAFDVVWLLVYGAAFPLVLWGPALVTEVTDDALHVRVSVRLRQTVPLSSIRRVEVVPYYPAIDGLWGVRRGSAVRVWLSAGDFLLVGTRRPDELVHALRPAEAAAA